MTIIITEVLQANELSGAEHQQQNHTLLDENHFSSDYEGITGRKSGGTLIPDPPSASSCNQNLEPPFVCMNRRDILTRGEQRSGTKL